METFYNDLKNQFTLAPLNENRQKLEEFYAPQHIGAKDTAVLSSLSKNSIASLEASIGALSHLLHNLKLYKEHMIDSINLNAESIDMSTKYSRDIPSQSNNLPGVISAPQTYDLQAIRKDNEQMMMIQKEKEKVDGQKKIYMRMCSEDIKLFLAAWKRLNISNAAFDEFVESLDLMINSNY